MELLLLICICFSMCWLGIKYYKKWLNPLCLFCVPFLIASLSAIFSDKYENIIDDAIFWIALGIIGVSLSFLFGQTVKIKKKRKAIYNLEMVDKMSKWCVVFAIMDFLLALYVVLNIAGSVSQLFYNGTYVRFQYLQRKTSLLINVLGWFFAINYYTLLPTLVLSLKYKRKNSKIELFIVILLRLLLSIVTMSKESFIVFIVIFVAIMIDTMETKRQEINFYKKYSIWFVGLVFILLFIISIQRSYLDYRYSSYFNAIWGTVEYYFAVPIISFAALLKTNSNFLHGRITFRAFYNILSYLGVGTKSSIIQDLIDGAAGNVYSIFGCMYRDYGLVGIVLLSIIVGGILGLLYNNNNGVLSALVINSIIIVTMFYGFYDFKLSQTVYLLVIIYAILFDKWNNKKLYVRSET